MTTDIDVDIYYNTASAYIKKSKDLTEMLAACHEFDRYAERLEETEVKLRTRLRGINEQLLAVEEAQRAVLKHTPLCHILGQRLFELDKEKKK